MVELSHTVTPQSDAILKLRPTDPQVRTATSKGVADRESRIARGGPEKVGNKKSASLHHGWTGQR